MEISFDKGLTVLVAQNGIGKTSILDAIRIMMWPYVKCFSDKNPNDIANSLSKEDVSIIEGTHFDGIALPSKINIEIDWNDGEHYSYSRFRNERNVLKDSNLSELTGKAKNINSQLVTKNGFFGELPVFGYYGTGRLWSFKKKFSNTASSRKTGMLPRERRIGYLNCLDPASSYRVCEDWVQSLFISYNDAITLYLQTHAPDGNLPQEHWSGLWNAPEKHISYFIDLVQSCLNKVLATTNYRDIAYRLNKITGKQSLMMFDISRKVFIPIDLLSDGVRNVISLVMDILYRCCKINPQLEHIANFSYGVVLIDEVDMHLHPEWQQTIIGELRSIFPNIQFIVTTHSPQVLTTVEAESIRSIVYNEDTGKFEIQIPQFTLGAKSNVVLKSVFNVEERPQTIDFVQQLNRYQELVNNDEWESEEAVELRKELDKRGKNQESQLEKLDIEISVKKMKRNLKR